MLESEMEPTHVTAFTGIEDVIVRRMLTIVVQIFAKMEAVALMELEHTHVTALQSTEDVIVQRTLMSARRGRTYARTEPRVITPMMVIPASV